MQWLTSVAGIELDAEIALHEPRGRLFIGRDAVVGVAAVLRPIDLAGHHRAHALGRHLVVLADAEVDQLPLGMLGQGLALGPLDLLELIDRGALAVIGAADAVGKQLLKIRIAHRCLISGNNWLHYEGKPQMNADERGSPDVSVIYKTHHLISCVICVLLRFLPRRSAHNKPEAASPVRRRTSSTRASTSAFVNGVTKLSAGRRATV